MPKKKKLIEIDIRIRGITVRNEAKKKEAIDALRKDIREIARKALERIEGVIRTGE